MSSLLSMRLSVIQLHAPVNKHLRSGAEALGGAAGVGHALRGDDVAELEAEAAKGGELFRTKDAADLHFRVNSHPQLGCLSGGEFADSLFDEVLVGWFGIEGLIERSVGFTHAPVGHLSFGSSFSNDPSNRLPLIRSQPKLLDWIRG